MNINTTHEHNWVHHWDGDQDADGNWDGDEWWECSQCHAVNSIDSEA